MRVKLSINFEIKNPWRLIVLAQVALKGLKLLRALHHAHKISKNKINKEILSKFDDL